MKKTMSVAMALMAGMLLAAPVVAAGNRCDTAKTADFQAAAKCAAAKEAYACPMHPEVTSDKPGKCPRCGMFLQKKATMKKEAKAAALKNSYVCPMHPEVKSDKPGKCPECGMQLGKAAK